MSSIIFFQRGEFEREALQLVLHRERVTDFAIVDKWEDIEPLVDPHEAPQLLFTAKIETPEGTRAIVNQFRAKNPRLFVVGLSTVDLGQGFDAMISKLSNFYPKEVIAIIREFEKICRFGRKTEG